MATSAKPSLENGLMLIYFIQNGATKVTKALVEKRIRELKPAECDDEAWTVDAFLKRNKKKILASRTGRNNEWLYFPTGSVTNIDSWDLKAIIFILIKTCELDNVMIMYLEKLAGMRNKLVHAASTSMEKNKYEHYRTKLSVILNNCLDVIGREELVREIDEMNEHLNGSIFFSAKTLGHQIHAEVRDGREVLIKHDREAYESLAEKLDTTIKYLEREPSTAADDRKTSVPELNLNIEFKDCTKDKTVELSQRMVEIFNDAINTPYDDSSDLSDEFRHNLRDAVYDTCLIFLSNGRHLVAEEKCVLLHIRCVSLVSLLMLFQDYINGILDKNIKVLQSAVRRCSGYEHTRLEVIVYKDDFWRILTQITEDLNDYLSSRKTSEQENSN